MLTQLAVILAVAFIGGAVFQRLKQPVLVGYIVVGLVAGPSLLGFIKDEQLIQTLAELGVLLLLFVVGIELQFKKFINVYRTAVLVTFSQIGIALITMFGIGYFFEWPVMRSLLLAFAISVSSTAVAIKLLQDLGEMDRHLGRTAVGVLIVQDMAVIPMLLIIDSVSGAGFSYYAVLKMILALGLLACLVTILIKKPAWFDGVLRFLMVNQQPAVMALMLCFVAAALAGFAGLSAAYGAFLAGLILGNATDRIVFEQAVKPIFDVLMMMFFLSIGLLLDFSFIQQNLLVISLLLFASVLLKTAVNIILFRLLNYPRRSALIMGACLGQMGEFSFVLAAMGLTTAVIQPVGYQLIVAVIALSLVVTPVWLACLRQSSMLYRQFRRARTTP